MEIGIQKTFFINAEACTGCGLCELVCSLYKEGESNRSKARIHIETFMFEGIRIPHVCRNCLNPPCVNACRRGALTKDLATGWVRIDHEKCNNCTLCIPACPYDSIILSPQGDVLLCDLCEGQPKCVEVCATGAIQFLDRNPRNQKVIQMKKTHPTQPWQALNLAVGHAPNVGKIFIVVDEDIDPRDWDSIIWALCWRVQAHRDIRITPGKNTTMDYSNHPLGNVRGWKEYETGSSLLIDATTKWDYLPVSLPRREFMERACKIWEEEGLPPLTLKKPWYGYSLGHWSDENEKETELALKGEHYKTGEKIAERR